MGRIYELIEGPIRDFINRQRMFFVATAPLSGDGHVNVSPKGLDTFRILDEHTVAYMDFVGSGIETVAHLKENGRVVLMFCAFEGPPKIVRLHGVGTTIDVKHPEFEALASLFPSYDRMRCIIRIRCTRISDSCGFGVPLFDFVGERPQMIASTKKQDVVGLEDYVRLKNETSIDGLPVL